MAPAVASYAEYRLPLAQHLLTRQLRHWEKSLRERAAAGLAALVPCLGASFLATEALDALLPQCLDSVRGQNEEAVLQIPAAAPFQGA